MGHPDSGEASKAKLMLDQVSLVEHFFNENRVEDT